MEFLIWVIIAIIIGAIKRASKGEGYPKLPRGFPKLPDGWDDTPLGPGGHRRHGEWPPKKVPAEQPTVPRQGQPMTMGRPGEPMSTGRPGQSMTGYPVPGPGQRDPSHDSPGPTYEGRGTEGRGEMEGQSEYKTKEPVAHDPYFLP